MPKTSISCPNCHQPIVADIDRLFDFGEDPTAKQRLLTGAFNVALCPSCGYQGQIATPIVYHDPEKELLLTFVPPEVGLPHDEQERVIGSMINQVTNSLPQDKRKGYLLRPQATLTLQGLVERVLEADGITKDMIQAQQEKLQLIQRLLETTDEKAINEIAQNEDEKIDGEFFILLERLTGASIQSGDQETARKLEQLRESLLPLTTFGREIQSQTQEMEAAVADLQAAGKELDRETMLDLIIKAPNDTRIRALVSLARPIFDYSFFQMLSERIDRARGDGRTRLVELRSDLLDLTEEIDRQVAAHVQEQQSLINKILQETDVKNAMQNYLPAVDEYFMRELDQRLEDARKQGDLELIVKLQDMVEIVEEASAPPPELALIEELLQAPDDQSRREILEVHQEEITPEFINTLSNIVVQAQSSEDNELAERAMAVNRQLLRFSMKKNISK
ncbi:CpXC domain-containing protein [Chloroflexota bacterium]